MSSPAFGLNTLQFEGLRAIDGRRSLADLGAQPAPDVDESQERAALLYLAERGAIDPIP
jgi:hypothetical protein